MSMLVADFSIIIPFLFVAFVSVLFTMCIRYVGASATNARSMTLGVIIGHPTVANVESSLVKSPRGMSSDVVRTFLIIAYSKMNVAKGMLHCMVCLSEFQDGDFIRMLPKCGHGFSS